MLKKIKILFAIILFALVLIATSNVNASIDVTKKLYQDITINKDGSITIKEMALLDGEYNGRSREIVVKNYNTNTFTGIYSNFTGNTDIYDGTSIKDIKIYDISQSNFNSIEDINKVEKVYKEVESANNGKYGVYTLTKSSYQADFKIYCPAKKKKVFCMEYTITDAVVVHNDVAELYWNVIGDNYRENIEDFQVIVHIPGEDSDLRVWTHGPLSGSNKIIDNKTVFFKDVDVPRYEPETIRIMFNKDLVPYATKKSNVDGKKFILKYEQTMADEANAERNNKELELINDASQAVLDLEKNERIYYYNYALKTVSKLRESEQKDEFIQRINAVKEIVNKNWKESIKNDIQWMIDENYEFLTEYRIESLEDDIEEGFDEKAKAEFRKFIPIFNEILEKRNAKIRTVCTTFVCICYGILLIAVVYELIRIIIEKNKYKGRYYREFPSEDNPYVLEYLMKKKITNLSFSSTILNLIVKKVIKLEKNEQNEKDLKLTLVNKSYLGTDAEGTVLKILFNTVGISNVCTLEKLKKFGKTESNARRLTRMIDTFKKSAKKEAEYNKYFKTDVFNIILRVLIVVNYFITSFMAIGVFKGNEIVTEVFKYLGIITIISIIYFVITTKYKGRTSKGQLEYSKWLAHKRFLKDFSNFDEKELPEITLWEKYLVTATILGCADKVEDKIKMHINNYDTSSNYLLLATSLDNNFIRTINNSVSSSIRSATYTVSSSSSSGGGFGGGSSGGGGGRRPEEAAEVVSKK